MRTLVVTPTYLEADNITEFLTRLRAAVPAADVLVVDDNSPDGTGDLAEKAAEELGQIEVMHRPGKSGLGVAYRAGFAWGLERGHRVLVEMDADLSHDPEVLPQLIGAVTDGDADLAIGSRYVPGGSVPNWPKRRLWLSVGGNRYAGFVLGMPVRDSTAGYRAYRASILRAMDFESTHSTGYAFQIEMTYRARAAGGRIDEVPIAFTDRVRGTSKMSGRIVGEAMTLVTLWGLRDRVFGKFKLRRTSTPDLRGARRSA